MNELTRADRNPVEVIAEEFAQRFRRGEPVSISEYTEKFPQHAEELREVLPSVAMMEELKRTRQHQQDAAPALKLEWIGDYHIIREIGRGGMGIVYEAEQKSLGRRVALKVLPRHFLLDPKRLQRFQREAQAAAQLHHTNIVPVFGIGEADGLHYYAMQYVQGQSLSQALEAQRAATTLPASTSETSAAQRAMRGAGVSEGARAEHVVPEFGTSAYWIWVARVGVQAAEALDYAHHQGILHRDVKPANILLDMHGIVWLADFGLAKLAEHTDLTAPGDIIGTLQYIAPETLQSQSDARSDVCSLGLTLYELLTLHPPFEETNTARLLRLVSESEPRRPRQIEPRIPRDLETIVLKASARHPEHRYAGAAQLAGDLRCFIDDLPIQARRTGSVERLWRWCRRNRVVASLAGAVAASLLLALGVGWTGYVQTRESLARESQRRREADSAMARAEAEAERAKASFRLSQQALQELFDKIEPADNVLLFGPSADSQQPATNRPNGERSAQQTESREKAELLQSILHFYDRILQENNRLGQLKEQDVKQLQADAAKAYRRIGDIHLRVVEPDKALAAYARALGIANTLHSLEPANDDFIALVAGIHVRLGIVLRRKDPKQAEPHFREAVAETSHFANRPVDVASQPYHLECALARYNLGDFMARQKKNDEARMMVEASIGETQKCLQAERAVRAGEPATQRPSGPRMFSPFMGRQLHCLEEILTDLGETKEVERVRRRLDDLNARQPRPPLDGRPPPPQDGRPPPPQDGRPLRNNPPPFEGPPPLEGLP